MMSRYLSPPLAAYFIDAILEYMKREVDNTKKKTTNEEKLDLLLHKQQELVHEIRHIAQSLGIPQEKIIT